LFKKQGPKYLEFYKNIYVNGTINLIKYFFKSNNNILILHNTIDYNVKNSI